MFFNISVNAQENEELEVNFSEFQFVTDDYNPKEVHSSTSASATADLLGAGFSVSGTTGGTTYYRRSFNSTGIVKLYK